jgi:Mn-dependent DtxR family transcriptional regulator
MRLTEKGERIALSVISRHSIISEFLTMIGVDEKTAQEDTEGIEHHIQGATIHRMERLVEFLHKNPECLNSIRQFLDKS